MTRSLSPAAILLLLPVAAMAEGLLPTHRIPAELANQAVAEAVASCAKQAAETWRFDKPTQDTTFRVTFVLATT